MDHISGESSAKWRKLSLSKRGEKALELLKTSDYFDLMVRAHKDTDDFRQFAERYQEKRVQMKESLAQFVMENESGQILLHIYDGDSGELQFQLSPEQVAEGLKHLEETDDNASPLSSFFTNLEN